MLNWNVKSVVVSGPGKMGLKPPSRPTAPVVKRVKTCCAADMSDN